MKDKKSFEVHIKGMDCADCALHVKNSLSMLPSITSAEVFLGAEKAVIQYENNKPRMEEIQRAVEKAGYEAQFQSTDETNPQSIETIQSFGKTSIAAFIGIVIAVFGITVIGEQMGFISRLEAIIPWFVWLAAILLFGFPVIKKVITALANKRIISHTLMTASMITAAVVGEWTTAMLIILFMRFGDYIERNTTEKARQAIRMLKSSAPQTACVIRNGAQNDVPISRLQKGDIVLVKPGESIPADGIVIDGEGVVNESAITGESMPAEKFADSRVHAASILQSGSLQIQTTAVGKDSLFGRIITMVEEAESNRGEIQSFADRFSSVYLPIVALIALVTYISSGNVIAAAAVMAVSCSCSFSLATPVAMLASIGTAAQQGLLFKGGKYIEDMEKIDTVFVDKTGTLTLGQPEITAIKTMNGIRETDLLQYAASVEQYSEHPLADAVLRLAREKQVSLMPVINFESKIGEGVSAYVNGIHVRITNKAIQPHEELNAAIEDISGHGRTLMFVHFDDRLAAILGAEDTLRPDAKHAFTNLKSIDRERIVLLSGDNTSAVQHIADQLGVAFRAEMLPHEKIKIVKEAQEAGHYVMMIGDGVNDAPALAQADIGIAMGANGTDIAIETAHIVLLREDWNLVPEAFRIADRTMQIVRLNIYLTAFYNLAGISLAAFGLLAPAVAAAMQSIPDVGIMANSARLLKKTSAE